MYNHTIHTISFTRGCVPGVNNKKFKEIILKSPKAFVEDTTCTDYILSRHEDSKFPMNPEFEKILNHIKGQFKYLHNKNLKLTSFWSHIHEKNMSTVTHNHIEKEDYEGTQYLSGVYYVQVPEKSGHFVLHYPLNSHVTHKFAVMPKASEFFLFSSAVDHHVTRNLSNELRISVSFNLKIEEIKK
jgi:hypothetical protein